MKTCFKKNKVKIKNFEKNENDFKYNQLRWSRKRCLHNMSKKLLISNSIMWAAAILVVTIVDKKQFAISILVILATVSLMNLRNGK